MEIKFTNARFSSRKWLLMIIMRTFIFLFCTTLFAFTSGNVVSQNSKIKIEENKMLSVDEVFDLIMTQTDYKFFYEEGIFKGFPKIQVNKGIIRTNELLKKSLSKGNFDIEVTANNAILIKEITQAPKPKVIQQQIVGRVLDEDGQPLPGVTILLENSLTGTETDFDGNFVIEASKGNVLVLSFIGMKTQKVIIGDETNINITLLTSEESLEEVVVVGYGTQKKVNLTGAVATVSSEALKNRPIVNLGQGLQGLVPNLNISLADGATGAEASFNIRGFTSTNGGSPLILIDGVEMDPNLVNPNEIESVSVLKDAASAAIYGSRAAFGVILITTKDGKKNTKPVINFNTSYTFSKPTEIPDLVDSKQWLEHFNETFKNWGFPNFFSEEYMDQLLQHYNDPANFPEATVNEDNPKAYTYTANTDWYDAVFKDAAPMLTTNLSIKGGGKNTTYYVSGGLLDQDGILKYGNDSYQRYNLRTKLDIDAAKWLQFNIKTAFTRTNQDQVHNYNGTGSIWHHLPSISPLIPVTNPDGSNPSNAITFLKDGGRIKKEVTDSWVTVGAVLNPLEGLKFTGSYSFNSFNSNTRDHKKKVVWYNGPSDVADPWSLHTTPTALFLEDQHNDYNSLNLHLDYEKTFSDNHYVKGIIGYNQEEKTFNYLNTSNQNLITDDIPSLNLTTGTPIAEEFITSWALKGYFYRLNYIYKDKYLLEFDGRYDATSRFPSEDRWSFFPSVSAAWRVSNESFFAPLKNAISELKIRGSFGELGNQSLANNFPYLPTLNSFRPNVILGGDRPLSLSQPLLVSSNLTWETATTKNIGLDASFFKSRLNFNGDIYEREVVNQLGPGSSVPSALGTAAPQANAVESITKGWELELNWKDRVGEFNYYLGFNLGDSQAEITNYDNPTKSLSGAFYEGQKIGEIWGFRTNGLFDSTEQYVESGLDYSNRAIFPVAGGDVWYVDQNDDGIIDQGTGTVDNPGDMEIIGNSTPRYNYGINLGASYKGFSLDIFMQGVGKRDLALTGPLFWWNQGSTASVKHLDYWTEDNKDAYYPRPMGIFGSHNQSTSDRYLQDFSYLRLKQLSISYSIPKVNLAKTPFKFVNIYFTGQNLFEWHNISDGFDPEINPAGQGGWGSGKSYPFSRSYSMGINLTF